MSSQTLEASIQERSLETYRQRRHTLHVLADRTVLTTLPVQWLVLVTLSAAAHRAGAGSHLCVPGASVGMAAILGIVAMGLPFAFVRLRSGERGARVGLALCVSLFYALLLWSTGARYGTPLYIFPALALLSFYRDARVVAVAAGMALPAQWLLATQSCSSLAGYPGWELSSWLVAEAAIHDRLPPSPGLGALRPRAQLHPPCARLARGFEVTTVFLERIRHYGSDLLSAPVRVLMQSAAGARPEA